MKTFYKILCACLACLCVVTYASRADRVAELETERDIYQSRLLGRGTEGIAYTFCRRADDGK